MSSKMNALRLVFVWQVVFALFVVIRPTMGIELLDETTEQRPGNSVDRPDGIVSDLVFSKDMIYKRNPTNEGNGLKAMWEKIPEELAEDYIKIVSGRAMQMKRPQQMEIEDLKK